MGIKQGNASEYHIVSRQQMNSAELAEVRELEAVCNRMEGLTLKLNWDMLQERKSSQEEANDFLCYSMDGQLIGFLALYGFGRQEIEVSGMVRPSYRRNGVFTELLKHAAKECSRRRITSFLFICERKSESGMAFLVSKGTVYDHSEHRMELPGTMEPVRIDSQVALRNAMQEDSGMLSELDSLCFGIPIEEARDFYGKDGLLSSDRLFVAVLDGVDIGMLRLSREQDDILIFGFAIKPEYRGKRYGRAALGRAVNLALADHPAKVALEVDCVNDTALNLYRSCGFQTVATYDYFRLPL